LARKGTLGEAEVARWKYANIVCLEVIHHRGELVLNIV
jgi:hypothetical protein